MQALLHDVATGDQLADLTAFCTVNLSVELDRPTSVKLTLPGDTAAIRGLADDGYPLINPGIRALKVIQDDLLLAHTILWDVAPAGDENQTDIDLTGWGPEILFPRRAVRDGTGNLANPAFGSPISGAAILQQALENTVIYAGGLPVDMITGDWDTDIPPAVDLAAQFTAWPMTIGELYRLIISTRAVDVVVDPVDADHGGYGPGVIGRVNAVNHYGSDLTETHHFDYATGDNSIGKVRRRWSMDTLCNKLVYELGPRLTPNRWRGNIVGDVEPELADFYALELASQAKYLWLYEDFRVFDSAGDENTNRPLYNELWKTEVTLRVEPRQELYVTPAADCPFRPFVDYNPGDTVASNLADIVGPEVAGAVQRIYGFDYDQARDGRPRVSELRVSPDGLA